MRWMKHVLLCAAGVLALLGLPFTQTSRFRQLLSGDTDAVSSASVVLDQPSGSYIVMINEAEHPDAENLAKWKQFFRGEDMGFLFEDISCSVAKGDAGALDLARSFQSQLPENQMSVRPEEATLLFSRADAGKFDILIVSQEFADIYHAQSARTESVDWIEMQGGAE